MHLALGGARADRAPGHQVREVLRRDDVEELAACRQSHAVHVEQQLAGDVQALADVEAAVEVRIVDEALPSHRGARLLEVHAHHDLKPVGKAAAFGHQPAGVFHRGDRVVDGAGTHHHDQAVVLAAQDLLHGGACRDHGGAGRIVAGTVGQQLCRRDQFPHRADAQVIGIDGHGRLLGQKKTAISWRFSGFFVLRCFSVHPVLPPPFPDGESTASKSTGCS